MYYAFIFLNLKAQKIMKAVKKDIPLLDYERS